MSQAAVTIEDRSIAKVYFWEHGINQGVKLPRLRATYERIFAGTTSVAGILCEKNAAVTIRA